MSLRRHVTWVVAVAIVAAVALPVLVYFTGAATLGPYASGGLGEFLADYLADLARLRSGAWTLLLGPMALVVAWRVVVALLWPVGRTAGASPASEGRLPAPAARRDPRIGPLSRE